MISQVGKHHIGVRETVSLAIIFVTAKVFLTFPRTLAERATHASWLVILLAAVASSLSWWPLHGLLRIFPRHALDDATDAALGSIAGTLFNLVYLTAFLVITALSLRQFSENVITSILPKTPLSAVQLIFLLTGTYLAYTGLEGIARAAVMYGVFMLFGLGVMLGGGLLTTTAPGALFPFWGPGPGVVLSQGLTGSSQFVELLIIGFLAPMLRKPQDLRMAYWWTHGLSAAIIAGVILAYHFIFPYPTASRVNFPLLEVSRMIIAGRWFQRLESVFLIIWAFAAALSLALGMFAAGHLLAHVMGMRDYRPLLFPLAVLVYNIALMPSSLAEAVYWDSDWLRTLGWVPLLVLPWVTWIIALIRNRGKQRAPAQ